MKLRSLRRLLALVTYPAAPRGRPRGRDHVPAWCLACAHRSTPGMGLCQTSLTGNGSSPERPSVRSPTSPKLVDRSVPEHRREVYGPSRLRPL